MARPARVKPMPVASEYGRGLLSQYRPMTGCRSEAVSW